MEKTKQDQLRKQTEDKLNSLLDNKKTLEILPLLLKATKEEVYLLDKTLNQLTEEERKVIQRVCIDNISPYKLEKEFGISYRNIYKIKNSALNKMTRYMYGNKFVEGEEVLAYENRG